MEGVIPPVEDSKAKGNAPDDEFPPAQITFDTDAERQEVEDIAMKVRGEQAANDKDKDKATDAKDGDGETQPDEESKDQPEEGGDDEPSAVDQEAKYEGVMKAIRQQATLTATTPSDTDRKPMILDFISEYGKSKVDNVPRYSLFNLENTTHTSYANQKDMPSDVKKLFTGLSVDVAARKGNVVALRWKK